MKARHFLITHWLSPVLLGAVAALSLPPVNFAAGWLIALPLFLWRESLRPNVSRKQVFLSGWLLGFGYFSVALHWIGNAFLVDAIHDAWMMPLVLAGLFAFLSLLWGLANALSTNLHKQGLPLFLTLPLSLALLEYLRGHVFTGFPWGVPGLAVAGLGPVDQLASLIGMHGLTLIVLLWAATPFAFWQHHRRAAVLVFATLPLAALWGTWHLAQNPTATVPGIIIRLVQPNISQSDKWRSSNARNIWEELKQLSLKPSPTQPTHIIWPESSVPFLLDEDETPLNELRDVLGGTKVLLAGAVRRQRSLNSPEPDYFTSILIFDGHANKLGAYDKWHLVPGGEFLPLASLLEPLGLRRLVSLPESFAAGPGPLALSVPGLGWVTGSICYEAIFPEAFHIEGPRPGLIVNVTNDGWFGNSAGPYQHLEQLRLRSIEQGLPAARAANTGISALIDPWGREIFASQIGEVGAYDVPLPMPAPATLQSRFGDGIFWLMMLICLIILTMIWICDRTRK